MTRLVILESPYAGDVERNVRYARAALRDSLLRNEAPLASHLLYTQEGVLDDRVPEQRSLGIQAGLAWVSRSEATVVYADYGVTPGMQQGIERAEKEGRAVELRYILNDAKCPMCLVFGPTWMSGKLCYDCSKEELGER